jgi:hypothetical protein
MTTTHYQGLSRHLPPASPWIVDRKTIFQADDGGSIPLTRSSQKVTVSQG